MAAAAERRIQEADSRGLKDPEGFKRKQQAQQQAEANLNPNQEAPLKVSFAISTVFTLAFQKSLFC